VSGVFIGVSAGIVKDKYRNIIEICLVENLNCFLRMSNRVPPSIISFSATVLDNFSSIYMLLISLSKFGRSFLLNWFVGGENSTVSS